MGTSVESQDYVQRIDDLRETNARWPDMGSVSGSNSTQLC